MRSVFIATGAFVGRIDHLTRLAFWAEEPVDHDFDPSLLIRVDLSRTPGAAASHEISWDAVEVDDCLRGPGGDLAGTTVGPRWPEMQLVGAVYLEEGLARRLPPAARPACPPRGVGGRDYEFKSVVYWSTGKDARAGRRYIGHHAEILEEVGRLARVAVYRPGTSDQPGATPSDLWIDLSSVEQCDAGPDSLTDIGVGNRPKKGALFLAAGRVVDARADGPKIPPWMSSPGGDIATESPKLPPLQADDRASGPKLPPWSGGAGRDAAPEGPKIPPLQADGASGPKLPPWLGRAGRDAAPEGPKLPPYQGDGASEPKLPIGFGE